MHQGRWIAQRASRVLPHWPGVANAALPVLVHARGCSRGAQQHSCLPVMGAWRCLAELLVLAPGEMLYYRVASATQRKCAALLAGRAVNSLNQQVLLCRVRIVKCACGARCLVAGGTACCTACALLMLQAWFCGLLQLCALPPTFLTLVAGL